MKKEIWILAERVANEMRRLGYLVITNTSKSTNSIYLRIGGTPFTIRVSDHIPTGKLRQGHVLVSKASGIRKKIYRKRGRRQAQYIYGPDKIFHMIDNVVKDCIHYRNTQHRGNRIIRKRKKAASFTNEATLQNNIA